MIYITASGSKTVATAANGLLIQVNKALTGTITLAAGGTTFAVIDTPPSGGQYRYNGLRNQGAITVNPSATTDITVSFLNRDV
jgi:hypothetical protein